MAELVMYDKEAWIKGGPVHVGDRVKVIRGNGPREGETMGWATIREISDKKGMEFYFDPEGGDTESE